jgi:hypothetical protein
MRKIRRVKVFPLESEFDATALSIVGNRSLNSLSMPHPSPIDLPQSLFPSRMPIFPLHTDGIDSRIV